MAQSEKNEKRRPLTAEKIVNKAMELADVEGLEALSMRKLAGGFGVTAMSLYNHIADKDELLNLMLNRVVAEVESPSVDGEWQQMMRHRAHSMRQVLLRHDWALSLLISRIAIGDAILRDTDLTVGCLVNGGFTYAQADWARNAIDSHVYGYTLQELNYPVGPEDYKASAAQYLPMIAEADYPYMHAAVRQIIDGKYDGVTQFGFGLELILEGLKLWLGKT